MRSPLEGLRVIDLASFVAGPTVATIMSDYGADVIKVEPPTGDRQRTLSGGHKSQFAWQLTGRNKRSIALDIKSESGYHILCEMIALADVLVTNFSTDSLRRNKLTEDLVLSINPKIIFANVTAYGSRGPDAEKPAFDVTGFFARSGILDLMRNKGHAPAQSPGGVGDHAAAMTLFAAVMMALLQRERTGEGAKVEVSLSGVGAWANGMMLQAALAGLNAGAHRDKEGWSNPFVNIYETKDNRYLMLVIQNVGRDWPKLKQALGHHDWYEDAIFESPASMRRNRVQVREKFTQAFAAFDAEQIESRLNKAGVVFDLVSRLQDVLADQQLIDNDVFVPFESQVPGVDTTLLTPFELHGVSKTTPRPAPEVGEHSRNILRELGHENQRIEELIQAGIVAAPEQKR